MLRGQGHLTLMWSIHAYRELGDVSEYLEKRLCIRKFMLDGECTSVSPGNSAVDKADSEAALTFGVAAAECGAENGQSYSILCPYHLI